MYKFVQILGPALLFIISGYIIKKIPDNYILSHQINPNRVFNGVRLNFGFDITSQGLRTLRKYVLLICFVIAAINVLISAAFINYFESIVSWNALACMTIFFISIIILLKQNK